MILLPQKVAYRGTISGLRISAVDGTAFIDACAALVPYADGSHLVEIYDASGRMLRGYLAAAGTGETLGAELVTNGDFSSAVGWTTQSGWSIADNVLHAVNTGEHTYRTAAGGTTLLALYKSSMDVSNYASGSSRVPVLAGNSATVETTTGNGVKSFYIVRTVVADNTIYITGYEALTADIDNASVKQVTAPSTSGATIVSAKGGATENFQYKNASFTYNAASYYCLIRKAR